MSLRWTEVKRLLTPKFLRNEAVAARKAANQETGKFFQSLKVIGAQRSSGTRVGGYKKTRKNKKTHKNKKRTKHNIRSRKHQK
jgi:hypothetical protein